MSNDDSFLELFNDKEGAPQDPMNKTVTDLLADAVALGTPMRYEFFSEGSEEDPETREDLFAFVVVYAKMPNSPIESRRILLELNRRIKANTEEFFVDDEIKGS